ncbi:hypothetical protein DFJ63DRAFT_313011 [Scheffersomyces coipomensis]|uniref:uncharacterized protein n=1 Tax=Scheffersomyces coipomensis TaxID=1788519 RepID=UPI00315C538F
MAKVLAKASSLNYKKPSSNTSETNYNGNIRSQTPPIRSISSSNSNTRFASLTPPPPPLSTSMLRAVSTPSPVGRSPMTSSPSSSSSLNLLHNNTNLNNNSNHNHVNTNNNSSPENDKLIKSLLKQFKKLENELNKFNSKKYNHSTTSPSLKGNILRTSLLPFLRSNNNLDIYFSKHSQIYKSLNTVIVSILIKWWYSLIGNLTMTSKTSTTSNSDSNNRNSPQPSSPATTPASTSHTAPPFPILYSSIPASDRNAYLECISRIVSRDEWNYVDVDMYKEYENLLVMTLDYSIERMSNLKNLSLSVSAFIGKIFAYSFFKLPNVSNALLFLLNVKQIMFENTVKLLDDTDSDNQELIQQLYSIFPTHLHYLIDFKGISNLAMKGQKIMFNCTPPPKHPVNGIKDPNGSWVRRWCNCDSNVFNSFFRHYLTIVSAQITRQSQVEPVDFRVLLNCPGFNVIISHIFHIFQMSISRISNNNSKFQQQMSISSPLNPTNMKSSSSRLSPPLPNPSPSGGPTLAPPPPPPPSNIPIKQTDIYYNSLIKIFKTLRDVIHASKDDDDIITIGLIKYFDTLFISIAQETSIYDFNKNGLILTIAYEFINHVTNNNDIQLNSNHNNANNNTTTTNNNNQSSSGKNFNNLIDWEFWLSCNYMMIQNTDHIQILLKNISFLFNIWDMIPESLSKFAFNKDDKINKSHKKPIHYHWLVDLNESFKFNFMNYLISNKSFIRFITHWNPIIRSYYLRLLTWRIIGINNYQSSIMIQTTKRVQKKLNKCYEILHKFTLEYQNLTGEEYNFELNYKPDNPLVNRKFGILPISGKNDYYLSIQDDITPSAPLTSSGSDMLTATSFKSSELRKTHAYEILDEAIYTCSTLTDESSTTSKKSSSSISLRSSSSSNSISSNSSTSSSSKSKNHSIVSSIGKLFKILSIDENEVSKGGNADIDNNNTSSSDNEAEPPVTRNSASLTSLSTSFSSLKSRSSSPSLMSFVSTPTSITDSTSSSVKDSDSESLSSSIQTIDIKGKSSSSKSSSSYTSFYNAQPTELVRVPPEIIRPIYKFDIIVDHESLNEKFTYVNNQNQQKYKTKSEPINYQQPKISYFPLCPRIPLISIFMNNDNYGSKFFINDEEELFIENFGEDGDEVVVGGGNRSSSYKTELEYDELFNYFQVSTASRKDSSKIIKLVNLGRSLNELNLLIEEFKLFLNKRIEVDQFNQDLSSINEFIYFKKIIPFLSVDSSNELKLLNAS